MTLSMHPNPTPYHNPLEAIFAHVPFLHLVLSLIKYALMHKLFRRYLTDSLYIWLALLTPFTYYESIECPKRVVQHILILVVLTFTERKEARISMAMLVVIQPTYLLLIVPVAYRLSFNKQQLNKFLVQTGLIIGGVLLWNICSSDQPWARYIEMYNPSAFSPNFNLMWLMLSHMFQEYRLLFSLVMFLLPLLLILPLFVIFRNIPYNHEHHEVVTTFCLVIIYYTSVEATIYDVYFYYLLLIPGYKHYKSIPGSLVMAGVGVLFGVIGIFVLKQWTTSFTVALSYAFYMMVPSWASMVIFEVEVLHSLTDTSS